MFCSNCGKEIDDKAVVCIHCGVPVKGCIQNWLTTFLAGNKSWLVALLLCIFGGVFGLHRFYVHKTQSGLIMLVLTILVFPAFISIIWAIIDALSICLRTFKTADGEDLI